MSTLRLSSAGSGFTATICTYSDGKIAIHPPIKSEGLLLRNTRPQLTLARQSETLRPTTVWVGVMMRNVTAAILAAFAGILLLPGAQAQTVASGLHRVQASQPVVTEMSAQRRVWPPTRLRVYPPYQVGPDGVYPRYYPGRNAVRDCTAIYQPEYRPTGTVIVPHMNCYWRGG
jgi:hypothetical protein